MISSFLKKVEGFDCHKRTCEPLTSRLKSYFESKECIDFDYSKDTLELSFKIFTGSLEEYSESEEIINNGEFNCITRSDEIITTNNLIGTYRQIVRSLYSLYLISLNILQIVLNKLIKNSWRVMQFGSMDIYEHYIYCQSLCI